MNKLKSPLTQAFIISAISAGSLLGSATPSVAQQSCPYEAQQLANQLSSYLRDNTRSQLPDSFRNNFNTKVKNCYYNPAQETLTITLKLSATHPVSGQYKEAEGILILSPNGIKFDINE